MSAQSHASGSAGPGPGPRAGSEPDPLHRVADLLAEQTRLLRRISDQLDGLARTAGVGGPGAASGPGAVPAAPRPGPEPGPRSRAEPSPGARAAPSPGMRPGSPQQPERAYPPAAQLDPTHPVHGVPRPPTPSVASPSYPAPPLPGRSPSLQRSPQPVRTGPRR